MTDERSDAEGTVDLAHEALIGGWPSLQDWLTQRRKTELDRRRLENKVTEWEDLHREGGFLDEAELAEAERWLASPDSAEIGHSNGLLELVAASRQRIDDERNRELAEARTLAGERAATARRLRQRLLVTGAFALLALLAFAAASISFLQARQQGEHASEAAASAARAEATAEANAAMSASQGLVAHSLIEDASGEDETAALLAVQAALAGQDTNSQQWSIGFALQTSIGSPFFSTQSPEHSSMVNTLTYSQDGRTLAVARDDGSIELWQDGAAIPCKPNDEDVHLRTGALAFNQDGTRLASTGGDGWVRVWRVGLGTCIFDYDLPGPGGMIFGVAFAGNASAPILTAGSCLVEAETPPVKFEFAPACPGETATVRVWLLDPATGTVIGDQWFDLSPGGNQVCALTASPDGRWLAASNCGLETEQPQCLATPGAIALWDMQASGNAPQCLTGHLAAVHALAFRACAGQTWLAAGSADRSVGLWTVGGEGPFARVTSLSGQNEGVRGVALSRDCAWLAAGSEDGSTGLWHIADITRTGMLVEPAPILIQLGVGTQWVRTVAFGGDNGLTIAAQGGLGRYRQWNLDNWAAPSPSILPGHTSYVRDLAFSPVEGSYMLASAAEDGTIRLWNAAGDAPFTIQIGDGSPIKATSVAISPDGSRLAAGDTRNTFHLWDITDPAAPSLLTSDPIDCPFDRDLMVRLSPGRDLLASGGCSGVIQLRDPTTGALLERSMDVMSDSSITALTFSPDGSMLAAGSLDGTITLWTRDETGFAFLGQVEGAHGGRVWTLAFHPEDDVLASGGPERDVMLWRVSAEGLTLERTLPGHANVVRALAFSPDGSLLISGSRDQTIRIWRTASLDTPPVVILDLAEWVRAIAISSDGSVLAAASDQGTIRLIVPWSDALAELACERIARGPLSQAEWDRFVGSTLAYQDTCAELEEDTGSEANAPVNDRTAVLPSPGETGISRRRQAFTRPPPRAARRPGRNAPGTWTTFIDSPGQEEGAPQ